MKRMGWMGAILVATLVGCAAGTTALSASAAAADNGLSQNAQTQSDRSAVQWTTVHDGREEAFSIQVPKGWHVNGGMYRYRVAYPRPAVEMTSPDGKTTVVVDDATIPNYQTPVPYRLPGGQQGPPVEAFISGDVFAAKYGLARFKSMCQSLELKGSEPKEPKFSRSGGFVQSTAGQATFSCTLKGEPMTGYVYAETTLVRGVRLQPSIWSVAALGGYLAPAGRAQQAAQVLQHSASTLVFNPEWAAFQKWVIARGIRILVAIANKTKQDTEAMNEHQKQWSKMMAGETDDFNDILTGQTFALDNATGRTYEVPTGKGGQIWMNSQQTVVNSPMQPGADFTPLQEISHR